MNSILTKFAAAVFDPNVPAPANLTDPAGRPAGKRFDVYRNNVIVGQTDALVTAFPVIYKLLGDHNFRIMARAYIRSRPSETKLMMFYGANIPEFLEAYEPVQSLGYLPDVARLELALRRSYHAADTSSISPSDFESLSPDRLMGTRLKLAPTIQVIKSDWPIYAIWKFNTEVDAPKPSMASENVLITRPDFDPWPRLLPNGGAEFVNAISEGATLSSAIDVSENVDLTATLGLLLNGKAIIEFSDGIVE